MNITPKESMLLMFIIGHYMNDNNLYYDNNIEITRIMNKLKSKALSCPTHYKIEARKRAKFILKKHHYETLAKNACGVNNNNITLNNK